MVQKMVRTCFGTNNTDNCARVCHSASVSGLAMTLGSGAMTNPIYEITHDVDVIMLVGSNPEEAHPTAGIQIRQAVANGTKLIVVDPRDIGLSKDATIHLKLRPGTNVAFANGSTKSDPEMERNCVPASPATALAIRQDVSWQSAVWVKPYSQI